MALPAEFLGFPAPAGFSWSRDSDGSGRNRPYSARNQDAPDEVLLAVSGQLAGAATAVQEAQLALSSLGARPFFVVGSPHVSSHWPALRDVVVLILKGLDAQ